MSWVLSFQISSNPYVSLTHFMETEGWILPPVFREQLAGANRP